MAERPHRRLCLPHLLAELDYRGEKDPDTIFALQATARRFAYICVLSARCEECARGEKVRQEEIYQGALDARDARRRK